MSDTFRSNYSCTLTVNRPLSTVTLIWGHDISGKPQGAGGIGGLLKSTQKVASASAESGSDPESSNLASCIFHYDSNGNVVLLTDSEGTEAARYAYDAFGKTMLATGPMAQDNKYRFSTKPVEETSSLSFYGYRYYAPQLGRWLSRDPIGERGGVNVLAAGSNDLVNRYDYLGLDGDCRDRCLSTWIDAALECAAVTAGALIGCGIVAICNPPAGVICANTVLAAGGVCQAAMVVSWTVCLAACAIEDFCALYPDLCPDPIS